MKTTSLTLQEYIKDGELVKAVSWIMGQATDNIYVSKNMDDAVREGYNGGVHKVLSDGRVVWLAKL